MKSMFNQKRIFESSKQIQNHVSFSPLYCAVDFYLSTIHETKRKTKVQQKFPKNK